MNIWFLVVLVFCIVISVSCSKELLNILAVTKPKEKKIRYEFEIALIMLTSMVIGMLVLYFTAALNVK